MTIRYVYSASAQDDSDSTWNSSTISYLTLQAALTAWATGDVIYVAHDHAETVAASITWTCSSTKVDRAAVYRVNRSTGSYSPTTGTDTVNVDVTGAGNDINANFAGVLHGLHVRTVDRINQLSTGVPCFWVDCYLETGGYWSVGASANHENAKSKNCTIEYNQNSANQYTNGMGLVHEGLVVIGDIAIGGWLWSVSVDDALQADLIGCDFTGMTNPVSEPLVNADRTGEGHIDVDFMACFIDASRVIAAVADMQSPFQRVRVHNTASDGSSFISQQYMMQGTVDTDTGVYFTGTDAAVDADGDTPVSREMIPTSICDVHEPLVSLDMLARVDTTGAKTFTVEIVENFTAALTQQECWLEVLSLNGASSTLWALDYNGREFIESSYTNLAAGAGLASWTGEPASSRSEKVTVTATVNKTGMFLVRLHLGKYESGKEFFYNPAVTVS